MDNQRETAVKQIQHGIQSNSETASKTLGHHWNSIQTAAKQYFSVTRVAKAAAQETER